MLIVERIVAPSPAQWDIVITEAMRNPLNSWENSDSYVSHFENPETLETADYMFHMGENDFDRAMSLCKGGSVHAKFRRQLPLSFTIIAPLYWWKEFETYRNGVAPNPTDIEMNSCSTMHTIHQKPFDRFDFSHEQMNERSLVVLDTVIAELNYARDRYLECKKENKPDEAYHWWYQMIQLLGSNYNQRRTITTNYEAAAAMHYWRHDHKLYEWPTMCEKVFKAVPYSELITVKPIKTGHWITVRTADHSDGAVWKCSCCGREYHDYIEADTFCGNCGAKMEEEE